MAVTKNIYVNQNLNGNTISGLGNAVNAQDAATKGQLDTKETEIKSYVDSKVENLGEYVGTLVPTALPTTGSGAGSIIDKGDWWYISQNGTLLGVAVHKGDRLQASVSNPNTSTNDATNTDFFILHNYDDSQSRYEISNLSLVADTPLIITHNLGYKIVQVSVIDSNNKKIDVDVEYVDNNNLKLTSNQNITVWGVVSL